MPLVNACPITYHRPAVIHALSLDLVTKRNSHPEQFKWNRSDGQSMDNSEYIDNSETSMDISLHLQSQSTAAISNRDAIR